MASVLLGCHPPRLPVGALVRAGALFGIAEGAVRVALTRMVAAGELRAEGGTYELAGRLLERQKLQDASRHPVLRSWDGTWTVAVVRPGARPPGKRNELRALMRTLRLAELREGVWMRPDNLDHDRPRGGEPAAQCEWFRATPAGDPKALAARLWDLRWWSTTAGDLRRAMRSSLRRLERSAGEELPTAFLLAAAVWRHLIADPLLPPDLVPRDWPSRGLRKEYEAYDRTFRRALATWSESQR